jgi:ribosome-associated protein
LPSLDRRAARIAPLSPYTPKSTDDTNIDDHRTLIPENELQWRFIRASGPGGQNVNKVSTAVQLRFDVAHSPALPEQVRTRLIALAGRRMTDEGILVIDARRHRSQARNREDAIERLSELVRQARERPTPRRKTRPTAASKRQRLQSKRLRGDTKRLRDAPRAED